MKRTGLLTSAADDALTCSVIALVGDKRPFSLKSTLKVTGLNKIIHSDKRAGNANPFRTDGQTFATGDTWDKVSLVKNYFIHSDLPIVLIYCITNKDFFQEQIVN